MPPEIPAIVDLGRRAFSRVHAEMREQLARVHESATPGEIWLVEHDPVFTAGRKTPDAQRAPGIVDVERGGQVTYHGPGQLVVYPIVRLPRRDVRAWLTALETFGVRVCAAFDLEATPSVDGTGVFVDGLKVASIGVAIRHWINSHGISINVTMDLSPYHRIAPCGLDPEVMSDLSRIAGRPIGMAEAKAAARAAVPELLAGT